MSLRARVLAGLALIAALLAMAAVVITRTTEAHLIRQVDQQLAAVGDPLGQLGFERAPGGPRGPARDRRLSSVYVGAVVQGSVETLLLPDLTGSDPPPPAIGTARATAAAETREPFTVGTAGSDLRYRVRASVDPRLDIVVLLAMPLDDVDDAVNRLVRVEIAVTAAILAVLGLVAWWVIHLGIRPIKQMTATATAIAGGQLSHRVADGDPHTEAGELGVALNNMLGRIEQAFDERTETENRLRRFVADASHELRTPVTTIRGYAELYRDGGLTDDAELGEAMRRTEQEAVRMGSLVDDLLLLARLDQGRPLDREPVDLEVIVADAARDAAAVDPHRPIATDVDGPSVVLGDEGRVRQVVANLVSNALVHTPPGTPVELRLRQQDGHAVLEVADRGPGMSEESAARAFERFYRADPSRSRHRGGSGLGLAIVQATVAAHGGAVSLSSGPGQGTTVTVQLPLAP